MGPRLTIAIDLIAERLLPASLRADPDVGRQAKRVAVFNATFLGWAAFYAGLFLWLGSPLCAWLMLIVTSVILASLLMLWAGKSPSLAGNLVCLGGWGTLTSLAVVNGGLAAASLIWYAVIPVVGVLTSGTKSGLAWMLACLGSLAAFWMATTEGFVFPQEISAEQLRLLNVMALAGLVICQFALAAIRVGVEERALAALEATNRKIEMAQAHLEMLKEGFGFSIEEWNKVRTEKAALERLINLRFGLTDDESGDDDVLDDEADDELLDDDLAELVEPAPA